MNRSPRFGSRRGVAALEFAFVAPMLVLLLLGGVDVMIWFQNKFRLDNAAGALGNMVAQAETLSLSAFPASFCSNSAAALNYFAVASQLTNPLVVCGTDGATIVSGIQNDGTTTKVIWQERTGDAGYQSLFGTPGNAASLPKGYTVPSGHSIITTELYSGVTPWKYSLAIMGTPGPSYLYAYSVFEPRSGKLVTPQ